jgi:hypothetical protein
VPGRREIRLGLRREEGRVLYHGLARQCTTNTMTDSMAGVLGFGRRVESRWIFWHFFRLRCGHLSRRIGRML